MSEGSHWNIQSREKLLRIAFEVGRVTWLQSAAICRGGRILRGDGYEGEASSWAPVGPSSEKTPITKHVTKQQFWLPLRDYVDIDNDQVSGGHIA